MKENEMLYIDMVALLEFVRKQLPDIPDKIAQTITNEMWIKADFRLRDYINFQNENNMPDRRYRVYC